MAPITTLGLKRSEEVKAVWGDLDPDVHQQVQAEWTYTRKSPTGHKYVFTLTVKVKDGPPITTRQVVETRTIQKDVPPTLMNLAQQVAPRLYEKDPRIGIKVTEGVRFPRSPLFDRNDYDPSDISQRFMISNLFEPFVCPFCTLIMDGRSIWCGGNVGFAHIGCAEWVKVPPSWWT